MTKKKIVKRKTQITKKTKKKTVKRKTLAMKKPKQKTLKQKTLKQKTKITKKPKTSKKLKGVKKPPLSFRAKKIQEIKRRLLAQRDILLAEAEETLNELPGQTVFPDLGDQAAAEIDRSFMLRLRGRERKLLKKIEEAIDRIEQRTFGICDKCGEEIDIRRIEARPVTTMCIDCKTQQEEEERRIEK